MIGTTVNINKVIAVCSLIFSMLIFYSAVKYDFVLLYFIGGIISFKAGEILAFEDK